MDWARHWEELFRHDEWNIGVVAAPISAFLDPGFRPTVRWLPAPQRGTFRADPFGWNCGDGLQILCEEWDGRTNRGRLAALDLAGHSRPLLGFPTDPHLSYPYFWRQPADATNPNEFFCVPEMWQSGQVRLFRASAFPREWTSEATLLPHVAGVDSTIFFHNDSWWLACTDQYRNPNADLYLWHARHLHGPWTPHLRNPVKSDLSGARPAGTPFYHQGVLHRPAQDCSRTYGGGIALQRVLRLTPEEFSEETVARLQPQPQWRWKAGMHTLSAVGDFTLLDAKRICFMPAAFRRVLRRKLRRWLQRGDAV